jgi:hypothetical protein
MRQAQPQHGGGGGFWRALARDENAATTLEWGLLLAAVALPSYYTIRLALATLIGHYQMMSLINSLPFP